MKFYKLYFPHKQLFHFGADHKKSLNETKIIFSSDSLLSALCVSLVYEEKQQEASKKIEELLNSIGGISSVYWGIDIDNQSENSLYFIKKPLVLMLNNELVKKNRKIPKQIEFISLGVLELWNKENCEGMKESNLVFFQQNKVVMTYTEFCKIFPDDKDKTIDQEKSEKLKDVIFFKKTLEQKVKIQEIQNNMNEENEENEETQNTENELFSLENFYFMHKLEFSKNIKIKPFLYFMIAYNTDSSETLFEKALTNLRLYGGLGGKLSIGKGVIDEYKKEEKDLADMKPTSDDVLYMCTGTASPSLQDIQKIEVEKTETAFQIVQKGGYLYGYNNNHKRRDLIMFAEGSCFPECFQPRKLTMQAENFNQHNVYKVSKPLWLKVARPILETKENK